MSEQITRRRLLDRITQSPGLWIVEACGGSGKSVLARQLAAHFGCRIAGSLAAVEAASQPGIIDLLDAPWEATEADADRLRARPGESFTVILCRRVDRAGCGIAADAGARWLRAADLWFDDKELVDLAVTRLGNADGHRLGKGLRALSDGWPAVAEVAVREAARNSGGQADFSSVAATALASVLEPVLAELPDDELSRLGVLSFFERFDTAMAEALDASDLLPDLVAQGIPLLNDGRWTSLRPVTRGFVRRRQRGLPDVGQKLFDHLVSHGLLIEAAEAATEVGQGEAAAEILAAASIEEAYALDADRSGALWSRLEPHLDDQPRSFLVRARRHLGVGDLTTCIDLLRHGCGAAAAAGTTPVLEETQAELAYALYLSGDLDGARSYVEAEDFGSAVARARQYEVRGGLEALTMNPDALRVAGTHFRTAEQLWIENGEVAQAGVVLAGLAIEVTSRLGRLGEAIVLLDASLTTAAANPIRRTSTLLMRARLLALSGRRAEAEATLREIDGLVGTVLRTWMAAQADQIRALIASHRRDAVGVERNVASAAQALGDLATHAPGAILHYDAVEAFARCEHREATLEHLALLRVHAGAEPADLAWAEVVAACRVGDAGEGLELAQRFREGDIAVPGGEWKVDFMQSIALQRLGRTDEAAERARSAQRGAEHVGTPDIIATTEEAPSDPRPAVAAPEQSELIRIALLEDFSVTVDGVSVELSKGQMRTLVKMLVLHGGSATVDQLLDALWPDGNPELGRRRVRNVLSRLRALCGDVVERDGELISLTNSVGSDFAQWWLGSVAILRGDPTEVIDIAHHAAAAPDILLPADQYEEWMQPLQRRYQLQLIRLLDTLADRAAAAGEIDVAVSAYQRGLTIDPWVSERVDAAVSLLISAGRQAEARAFERLHQMV